MKPCQCYEYPYLVCLRVIVPAMQRTYAILRRASLYCTIRSSYSYRYSAITGYLSMTGRRMWLLSSRSGVVSESQLEWKAVESALASAPSAFGNEEQIAEIVTMGYGLWVLRWFIRWLYRVRHYSSSLSSSSSSLSSSASSSHFRKGLAVFLMVLDVSLSTYFLET